MWGNHPAKLHGALHPVRDIPLQVTRQMAIKGYRLAGCILHFSQSGSLEGCSFPSSPSTGSIQLLPCLTWDDSFVRRDFASASHRLPLRLIISSQSGIRSALRWYRSNPKISISKARSRWPDSCSRTTSLCGCRNQVGITLVLVKAQDIQLKCLLTIARFLQSDDEFVRMLAEVRSGGAAASVVACLQEMCKQPVTLDGITATKARLGMPLFDRSGGSVNRCMLLKHPSFKNTPKLPEPPGTFRRWLICLIVHAYHL